MTEPDDAEATIRSAIEHGGSVFVGVEPGEDRPRAAPVV